MRRAIALTLAVSASLLAACGGGGHKSSTSTSSTTSSKPTAVQTITSKSGQREYKVKLPNGQVVIQAHSPALAEPPKSFQLPPPTSTAGTAEQYDSVTVSTIPSSAHYVAGYVDGLFRTYPLMKGRFPVVVGISVSAHVGADCLDMEPGNPGPTNAGPWAKWQMTQGNTRPCEYSMLSWMGSIRSNLRAYGIPVCTAGTQTRCVRLWDANWNYRLHLDAGYACTQWTDHAFGRNLDESTCQSWFYQQQKPAPAPTPTPTPTPTPKPKPTPASVTVPVPASAFSIFPTLKLKTPHGTWSERQLVESIDGALQHKAKYASYLKNTLDPAALWFAGRIVWLANNRWPNPHPNWNVNHGGSRRAYLVHAAAA